MKLLFCFCYYFVIPKTAPQRKDKNRKDFIPKTLSQSKEIIERN